MIRNHFNKKLDNYITKKILELNKGLEKINNKNIEKNIKISDQFFSESQNDIYSSINKIEELGIKLSSILELDEIDAHVYLNLLRLGPVTASALAKELHMDRTKAYRTIDKLLHLQIVSTTLSKPKLCVANKPEDVLNNILQQKENQVNRIKNSQQQIIESIQSTIPTNFKTTIPTFHVTQGTGNIYSEIEKLIEESEDIVYLVTTLKDISKMYHTDIPEKIKICEKNGGEVRLITEMLEYSEIPFIRRFGATSTRMGILRTRGRMIVEKNRNMILSDALSDHANSESDFAICTNSVEMSGNIFTLCSLLWENSKPLNLPHVQVN